VVGVATVTELLRRGHTVRLFSRNASDDARQWPAGIEVHEGSVTDPATLLGAADGCAAVIHLTAVITEDDERTFDAVNVEGTRHVVAEAMRAQVQRFVYVSSLGADRGESPYHKSKLVGEEIALASRMNATVVRLANVYGPGDQVISLLIKLIRMLPVVPAIDGGDDVFQPIWVGDAAAALVAALERADLGGRALDVAGPDRTCMNDLIGRVRDITGRTPLTVPVTGGMAALGAKFAALAGVNIPIDRGQITMLEEGNVIREGAENALELLKVAPTPLDQGLCKLADTLPEQLPDEGVGGMRRKRVWADIEAASVGATALFERFREAFSEVTPWSMTVGSEPGTPTELQEGETMTMSIPLRGNVQVRVEELTDRTVTLVTLEGHPLAGAVRFIADELGDREGDCVRFEVQVYDRAADIPDWLIMRTVGQYIQLGTWKSIVRRVVADSGGTCADGIHHEITTLDDAEATRVEEWLREMVMERKRETAFVEPVVRENVTE
jgi:uncharacterized protein YbjT (DUF2867 family)